MKLYTRIRTLFPDKVYKIFALTCFVLGIVFFGYYKYMLNLIASSPNFVAYEPVWALYTGGILWGIVIFFFGILPLILYAVEKLFKL